MSRKQKQSYISFIGKKTKKYRHSRRELSCEGWKRLFVALKIGIVLAFCGVSVTVLHFVVEDQKMTTSDERAEYIENPIQERMNLDERYLSSENLDWPRIAVHLDQLKSKGDEKINMGLLNFNKQELHKWNELLPDVNSISYDLEPLMSDVTWKSFYPEWIDEEQQFEVPHCPGMRLPTRGNISLDIVSVKLPCKKPWSRDVARMHLQLATAHLAMSDKDISFVLLVSECWPMIDLFSLRDLVVHENNMWLFKIEKSTLKQKLELPVGSCELATTIQRLSDSYTSGNKEREAYATVLHSGEMYVCGAIVLAQSIRNSDSSRDMVILVDKSVSIEERKGLEAAGWKVRQFERIRNPKATPKKYNEWNYSKFRLWQLTDYDKIVFLDSDLLVLKNMDLLFGMPEITATGNDASRFNSGVMVIEPSNSTFKFLMDQIHDIDSYNGGDQGFLNEIFTWWHRIPKHMNFLKFTWSKDPNEIEHKTSLFGTEPPTLYAIHYLGEKPWWCYKDYDCNWNHAQKHKFANDAAHARWWKMHDLMPNNLHKHCMLSDKQKFSLEFRRRKAESKRFADEHWKRVITDPRLHLCQGKHCSKKRSPTMDSMNSRKGVHNTTSNKQVKNINNQKIIYKAPNYTKVET